MLLFLPIKEGTKYFTLKSDRIAYSCDGALSFCLFDKSLFRGKLYRNLLDASVLGRSWLLDPVALSAEGEDDRFNATAPHDEAYKDTLMVMFDTNTGTGNVVAVCKFKDFEQFSMELPARY